MCTALGKQLCATSPGLKTSNFAGCQWRFFHATSLTSLQAPGTNQRSTADGLQQGSQAHSIMAGSLPEVEITPDEMSTSPTYTATPYCLHRVPAGILHLDCVTACHSPCMSSQSLSHVLLRGLSRAAVAATSFDVPGLLAVLQQTAEGAAGNLLPSFLGGGHASLRQLFRPDGFFAYADDRMAQVT